MSAAGAAQEAYREQPETERTPARAEAELVARIAQYARRVGRSAFKGRVRVGIENAAVIAEGRNGKYTYIEYARFADSLLEEAGFEL